MNQRGVHSQRHNGWRGQSLYYQSLRPPHCCQESDPDTVAAPSAQRQKVGEYQAKIPFTVAKKASSKSDTCLAQWA